MAQYDLTAVMAAQMDCHLVFPILEFLQERQLYADGEILQGKICLLSGTNMVDYAMDIHKSLHGTDDVPADMVARRSEVVARLRTLDEAAAPIVAFLSNQQLVQELRPDKQYNIQMLQERYQVRCPQQSLWVARPVDLFLAYLGTTNSLKILRLN